MGETFTIRNLADVEAIEAGTIFRARHRKKHL